MAITVIVEDGSGVDSANAYLSVSDMAEYAAASLYSASWTAATPDNQSVAVVYATQVMDQSFAYYGYKSNLGQSLEWPRQQVPNPNYPSYLGVGYRTGDQALASFWGDQYFPNDKIPKKFKQCVAQMVLELLKTDRTAEASSKGLSSIGVGSGAVSVVFNTADVAKAVTNYIRDSMQIFGDFRGGSTKVSMVRG